MNILSLGTEQKLFDPSSRVYQRILSSTFFSDQYYHFVFTKNKLAKIIIDKNVTIVPIYGGNKLSQILSLAGAVRKQNINRQGLIVSTQDPFEIGLIGFIIAALYKAKLVVQMHSDISSKAYQEESFRNKLQAAIASFVFRRADRVRVVSGRMQKFLQNKKNINKNKIWLLPIYSVLEDRKLSDSDNSLTILMLCRIEKVKQIPLAIEAVSILRAKSDLEYILKIVGEGSLRVSLKAHYQDLSWVMWSDFTEDIESEYQAARALLITSEYEGYAMTAVESLSFGRPVVMTDVGCAGDIVIEGLNGSIAKDKTGESVAEALTRVVAANYSSTRLRDSLEILGSKQDYDQKIKALYTF